MVLAREGTERPANLLVASRPGHPQHLVVVVTRSRHRRPDPKRIATRNFCGSPRVVSRSELPGVASSAEGRSAGRSAPRRLGRLGCGRSPASSADSVDLDSDAAAIASASTPAHGSEAAAPASEAAAPARPAGSDAASSSAEGSCCSSGLAFHADGRRREAARRRPPAAARRRPPGAEAPRAPKRQADGVPRGRPRSTGCASPGTGSRARDRGGAGRRY